MNDQGFAKLCLYTVVENMARYGELLAAKDAKKEVKNKLGCGRVIVVEAEEVIDKVQEEIQELEDFFLSDDFYNIVLNGCGEAADGEYIMNEIKRRVNMGMKIRRDPNLSKAC